jgi:hypothetical protein
MSSSLRFRLGVCLLSSGFPSLRVVRGRFARARLALPFRRGWSAAPVRACGPFVVSSVPVGAWCGPVGAALLRFGFWLTR